jgi:hypothetical protein
VISQSDTEGSNSREIGDQELPRVTIGRYFIWALLMISMSCPNKACWEHMKREFCCHRPSRMLPHFSARWPVALLKRPMSGVVRNSSVRISWSTRYSWMPRHSSKSSSVSPTSSAQRHRAALASRSGCERQDGRQCLPNVMASIQTLFLHGSATQASKRRFMTCGRLKEDGTPQTVSF